MSMFYAYPFRGEQPRSCAQFDGLGGNPNRVKMGISVILPIGWETGQVANPG